MTKISVKYNILTIKAIFYFIPLIAISVVILIVAIAKLVLHALTITICADGDSVTAYPGTYANFYKSDIFDSLYLKSKVFNVAVGGQSQASMLARLPQSLGTNPDIISVCTALNDLKTPDSILQKNITTYINKVLSHRNPNGKYPQLILMTDNYAGENLDKWYARPRAIQSHTHDVVLSVYEKFSKNPNIQIIDNFPAFYQLADDTTRLYKLLLPDHVHPNAKGYQVIHQNVLPALIKAAHKVFAAHFG